MGDMRKRGNTTFFKAGLVKRKTYAWYSILRLETYF